MLRTNHILRGCMGLLVVGCIVIGASAGLALGAFRVGWIAPPRHAVLLDLGPFWIGDRCRRMQEDRLLIGCFASYTIAVNINGSLRSYTIVAQPHRAAEAP
jgi:hypothetical protein